MQTKTVYLKYIKWKESWLKEYLHFTEKITDLGCHWSEGSLVH